MFQTEVVEKIKTRLLCSITFFEKHAVSGNVENCFIAGLVRDDNMAYEHCMMDT